MSHEKYRDSIEILHFFYQKYIENKNYKFNSCDQLCGVFGIVVQPLNTTEYPKNIVKHVYVHVTGEAIIIWYKATQGCIQRI